jgi:REP element-mobilizing transposase RayT
MKKPKQLEFKKVNGWGGRRKGSGRKNRTSTVNHMAREKVDFKKPLLITLKLKKGLKGFRTRKMKAKFEECGRESKKFGFHVLQFSLLLNHIHVLIEAKNNEALSKGMKSLGGRMGKALRAEIGGKGSVFNGRYHLRVLNNPTQTKNAMAYVLLNHSNHEKEVPRIDFYSSARHFFEWKALVGRKWSMRFAAGYLEPQPLPEYLSPPKSWLAKEGWKRSA